MVQATPAVVDASRILKFLTRYRTARGTLTQIASDLSIPKSSCSRILRALVDEGLLAYESESKMYSLGPYAVVIGSRASETIDYLGPVRTALQELASRTGLTAAWIQRVDADRLMYVAKQEGTANPHVSISIGNRFPLLEVSWGQWVVAYANSEDQRRLLERGLPRVSATNITDEEPYLQAAMRARELGVLATSGEYMPGIWAASAPVLTHEDQFVGIVSIIGILELITQDERVKFADLTREVVSRSRVGH